MKRRLIFDMFEEFHCSLCVVKNNFQMQRRLYEGKKIQFFCDIQRHIQEQNIFTKTLSRYVNDTPLYRSYRVLSVYIWRRLMVGYYAHAHTCWKVNLCWNNSYFYEWQCGEFEDTHRFIILCAKKTKTPYIFNDYKNNTIVITVLRCALYCTALFHCRKNVKLYCQLCVPEVCYRFTVFILKKIHRTFEWKMS